MASARARMPVPPGDLTPEELCERVRQWAESQGYEFALGPHASEFGRIVVRDPAGGFTTNTVPKPHRGKRLRQDQVRYVVQKLNNRWRG